MDRYETIIQCQRTTKPLVEVAQMLVDFIKECDSEGMNPQACPAVMLLGAQLAFHCHADVSPEGLVPRLLQRCVEAAAQRDHARRSAN